MLQVAAGAPGSPDLTCTAACTTSSACVNWGSRAVWDLYIVRERADKGKIFK